MAQTYYAILTAIGEARLANAAALGSSLQLSSMAVGDGNGHTPQPSRKQTALVHERYRAPLNQLSIDPANPSQIVAEQIIPEEVGGWWIRELGLYDAAGDLCAVANCPDTYKPVLASGSGRTQIIRMVLIVTHTDAVELKIDPSVVLATREYADRAIAVHAQADDPHPQYAKDSDLANHLKATDPHPQYTTDTKVAAIVMREITRLEGELSVVAPVGKVSYFARSAPPEGWLKCNGAALSRTNYATLFTAIGTTFGAGDGENTFTLPDLRGEFLRGWDDERGVDNGRIFGSKQIGTIVGVDTAGTPQGSVPYSPITNDYAQFGVDVQNPSDYPNIVNAWAPQTWSTSSLSTTRTDVSSGVARPRNIALLACIKFKL